MKQLLFLFFALQSITLYSQVSPAPFINYQGVARELDGTPIKGTIGVELFITQGSAAGATVLTEHYAVPTNTFGIFNLKIGSDKPVIFAAIDWSNGPYHVTVKIDPLGGTNYTLVSQQELASVPYALYAKEAKNARNYVPGTNVTITGPGPLNTYTINAGGGSSGGVDTIKVFPSNHNITSNGYSHSLTIVSPSINSANSPMSFNNNFPNNILTYTYPSLAMSNGSVLTLVQGSYTSTPVTFTANSASIPLWTNNGIDIVQTNTNALVGIGLLNPTNKLDVIGNTPKTISATNTGTGTGIFSSATTGAALFAVNSSATAAAIQANNAGAAESFYASKSNVQTGTVAKFENLNPSNSASVLVVNAGGSSTGIRVNVGTSNAINASSNGGTPSIFATNTGGGSAVEANNTVSGVSLRAYKTTGSGSAADFFNSVAGNTFPVLNINNASSAGGTGINITHTAGVGINAITNGAGNVVNLTTSGGGIGLNVIAGGNSAVNAVNSGSTAPTIFANNSGVGTAIHGIAASGSLFSYGVHGQNNGSGSGVYGETSSNTAGFNAGVYGLSTGDMPAMLARNMWGSSSTAASGIRAMTNSSHLQAAGVHGENLGAGPAVKASLATTVSAGSNNVAIVMEHGHLKSVGTAPTITNTIHTGIIPGPTLNATINNATDVRGSVAINFTTTLNSVLNGATIDVAVMFNKPYTNLSTPIIILTPTTDLMGMDYRVTNVSHAGFIIRVYKTTNSAVSEPSSLPANGNFVFNYMIME